MRLFLLSLNYDKSGWILRNATNLRGHMTLPPANNRHWTNVTRTVFFLQMSVLVSQDLKFTSLARQFHLQCRKDKQINLHLDKIFGGRLLAKRQKMSLPHLNRPSLIPEGHLISHPVIPISNNKIITWADANPARFLASISPDPTFRLSAGSHPLPPGTLWSVVAGIVFRRQFFPQNRSSAKTTLSFTNYSKWLSTGVSIYNFKQPNHKRPKCTLHITTSITATFPTPHPFWRRFCKNLRAFA